MNPLAALSIDRKTLAGENYRPHGRIFYSSIQPVSSEKTHEEGTSVPLGYDLVYKTDVTLLDGQKSANGYTGLYKNSPPELQKPLVVPSAGGDGPGLNHQVLSSVKQSEPRLNSAASSFLRLPWISPYTDATMYPFLDVAYKTTFLSQPSPFIHQQLAYQPLCASGSGSSTPREDRLVYLPHYTPNHISSPLGPPIQIHTTTPTPSVHLSALTHSQDKALQGLGLQVTQECAVFSTSPQIHQDPQPQSVQITEQQHGNSNTKPNPPTSATSTLNSKSVENSVAPVNGSISIANPESQPVTHPPCSVSPLQPLSNITMDLQKSLYKSNTSSSATLPVSHSLYMGSLNSETCSSEQTDINTTKDASSDCYNADKCISPARGSLDRVVPQKPAKNTGEKPLDLSAKELEGFANGLKSNLETPPKLEYLPPSTYRLLMSHNQPSKESLTPSVNKSAKTTDQREKISTKTSPWVVNLGPSVAISSDSSRSSQMLKHKNVDHHPGPQISPGSTASRVSSIPSPSTGLRSSDSCPSPKSRVEWLQIPPTDLEKVNSNKGEIHKCLAKHSTTYATLEGQEIQSHLQQKQWLGLEKKPSSQIYCDSYLPPGLGYTNRYIPYSVAENISLQYFATTGKGPVYPHSVLLGSNFYPASMAAKHGLQYGMHSNQGEFTYPNSQRITPPISSYSSQIKSHQEIHDKTWNPEPYKNGERLDAEGCQKTNDKEKVNSTNEPIKTSSNDETISDLSTDQHSSLSTMSDDSFMHGGSGYNQIHERQSRPTKTTETSQSMEQRRELPPKNSQPQPPNHSSSQPYEEILEEQEPLSPLLDIPEEQTMRCARTSLQFSRKNKTGISGGEVELIRGVTDSNNGINGMSTSNESKSECSRNENANPEQSLCRSDNSLGDVNKESCSSETNNSNIKGAACKVIGNYHSDSPVCISEGSGCKGFSSQAPTCVNFNPRFSSGGAVNTMAHFCGNLNPRSPTCSHGDANSQKFISRNFVEPCGRNRATICEPRIYSSTYGNSSPVSPNCRSINLRFANTENHHAICPMRGNLNFKACLCQKNRLNCPKCGNVSQAQLGNEQTSRSNNSMVATGSFPLGPMCQHLSSGISTNGGSNLCANMTPELPINKALSSNKIESRRVLPYSGLTTSSCGDWNTDTQDTKDPLVDNDDEVPSCTKNQCTSITKNIANTSSYVAKCFKCTATNLYVDSSKLSREQSALQVRLLPAFKFSFLHHFISQR